MPSRVWCAGFVLAVVAACSPSRPSKALVEGRLVVVLTVDWEGAYLAPENLDALDALRDGLGDAPLTHYVSSAYFTKGSDEATDDEASADAGAVLTEAVRAGDELAVHLHAWRSLARASSLEPKLHPSFLTGTGTLLEFADGDVGFETDLDVYNVTELRALLRTSRQLLEQTKLPVSRTFRAGGYLGTPKVLQALREEGYTVDSSAIDFRQLAAPKDAFLSTRIQEVWPKVGALAQPYLIDVPGGQLLEMPIAGIADHIAVADIVALFDEAHARLQRDRGRDVFLVLGFHQETAQEFARRLADAIAQVRAREALAADLLFTTVEKAAVRAQRTLGAAPRT